MNTLISACVIVYQVAVILLYGLMDSAEFMLIAVKNYAEKVHKNKEFVDFLKPVLPKNEGLINSWTQQN